MTNSTLKTHENKLHLKTAIQSQIKINYKEETKSIVTGMTRLYFLIHYKKLKQNKKTMQSRKRKVHKIQFTLVYGIMKPAQMGSENFTDICSSHHHTCAF